jgi:hypothetical protein
MYIMEESDIGRAYMERADMKKSDDKCIQLTTNTETPTQPSDVESNCCSNSCFSSENCTLINILSLLRCWEWTCNPH